MIYAGYADQTVKIYSLNAIRFRNSQDILTFIGCEDMN
jgi:hypothetical protein